jgi:hypothetical protein
MDKPEESLVRCRDSLVSVLLQNPRTIAARKVAAEMGAQARRELVTPERMLVDLKRAIDDVALMRRMDCSEAEETRERLVTIAIDAYYADR